MTFRDALSIFRVAPSEDHAARCVEAIREAAGDDEVAHVYEDELRETALNLIAAGVGNAKGIAEAVLKTNEIDFSRWYA